MGRTKSGTVAELDKYIREQAKLEGFTMNRTQALQRILRLGRDVMAITKEADAIG